MKVINNNVKLQTGQRLIFGREELSEQRLPRLILTLLMRVSVGVDVTS
jgi:hypothetical protein